MQVAGRADDEERAPAVAEARVDAAHLEIAGADHVGEDEVAAVDGGAILVGDDGQADFSQLLRVLGCARRLPQCRPPADHRGQRPGGEEGAVGVCAQGDGGPGGGHPLEAEESQVVGECLIVVLRVPVDVVRPDALPLGVIAQIVATHQHIDVPGVGGDTVAGSEHPLRGNERAAAVLALVGVLLRCMDQGDHERVLPGRVDLDAADDAGNETLVLGGRCPRVGRSQPGGEQQEGGQAREEHCRPASGHDDHPSGRMDWPPIGQGRPAKRSASRAGVRSARTESMVSTVRLAAAMPQSIGAWPLPRRLSPYM